jgi:hypothetical protein
MDPACKELGDLLALPLRSHVPCSMNCSEIETIVLDDIARNLTIGIPRSPGCLNWPIEKLNPSSCAISRYSSISITRVENHSIIVLLKNLIDPERAFVLIGIVSIN